MTALSQLDKGIFHTIWHQAQYVKLGKEEEREEHQGHGICFPK